MSEINISPGDKLQDIYEQAIKIAKQEKRPVKFTFNGVPCIANADTNINDELKEYHFKLADLAYIKEIEALTEMKRKSKGK